MYSNKTNRNSEVIPNHRKPDYIECVWLHLQVYNLIVLSIYIPPNINSLQYQEAAEFIIRSSFEILDQFRDSKLIIAGDLNRFPTVDLENDLHLEQIVNLPTRGTNILDKVLIDQSLTTQYMPAPHTPKRFSVTICPRIGNSDHETVYIKPVRSIFKECSTWIKLYDFRESHMNAFRKQLKSFPWHKFYLARLSVDDKCQIFHEVLENALSIIPCNLVEMKSSDKPWITPTLKSLINKRYEAYRQKDFNLYNHYKRKLKHEILTAKQQWVKARNKNTNALWKVVKNVMNKNSQSDIQHIIQTYPTPQHAAHAINEELKKHFSDSPNWTFLLENLPDEQDWNVSIQTNDILFQLLHLKTNKAAGSDGLSPKLIKAAAFEISEPLTHIIALSIQ